MGTKRWIALGTLAALLLATGPAVGTALAQGSDGGELITPVSEPGYLCDTDGFCYSIDGYGIIFPSYWDSDD